MQRIIRVFPRRTNMTPTDDYAFVGDPPMFRPPAVKVHISCSFTWDIPEARRLAEAWGQHYLTELGGAAFGSEAGRFTPGMYLKYGVTITSRGCKNQCPWCLVPQHEGQFRELVVQPGNIVQDNSLLQSSPAHLREVFDMLRTQHSIRLSGGFDSRLLTDSVADELRGLRVSRLFFAADTKEAIKPLERAKHKLEGFSMNELRAFVLIAFSNETIDEALARLIEVYQLGFMPFAQLYQPADHYISYSREWRELARLWTRPAITKAFMRAET